MRVRVTLFSDHGAPAREAVIDAATEEEAWIVAAEVFDIPEEELLDTVDNFEVLD